MMTFPTASRPRGSAEREGQPRTPARRGWGEGEAGVRGGAPLGSHATSCDVDVVVAKVDFDTTTRTIVDGRTFGFVKVIVDKATRNILGCHVVGERAVDLAQVAAVAMAAGMTIDKLAEVPLSFPTYAGVLGRAAAMATRKLNNVKAARAEDYREV